MKEAARYEPAAVGPDALTKAIDHLISVQYPKGYWEAEMVWNTMLTSQWVIVQRVVGRLDAISDATRAGLVKQFEVMRTPEGAWGMHCEDGPKVFFTVLAYVALRLLGLTADHPLCAPALGWLRAQRPGVLAVPSWGKFWLAMIGLYEYEGMNPIPPELFMMPQWVPLHPNHYYCHTRYIYLGIAYLYGRRFRADLGPITRDLRRELYDRPYDDIDFSRYRHEIAETDVYVRPSAPLRAAYDALHQYEKRPSKLLRKRALAHCLSRIVYEQEASRGQGISPVNGLLDCLALHAARHPLFSSSIEAMEAWRWQDEAEGIRYTGARSTSWDTAFAMRAMLEAPERSEAATTSLRKSYAWLAAAQMKTELPEWQKERRDPIRGGWCFSDGAHRWAVSDCTAEALSALMLADATPDLWADGPRPEGDAVSAAWRLGPDRYFDAARFILRRQNGDGGFGTYESRRGSLLLEHINPSEMYGNCMTERSYTECTASCVGALARFRARFPSVLRAPIDSAIARGVTLLRSRQRDDGSYLGFWGVNFTYAIFHVVEALRAAGVPPTDPAIARATAWLEARQKRDGGWGEHWKSALTDEYTEHPESQAAMTAWALLALMEARPPDHPSVARGVDCLRKMQLADGKWPRQSQAGVFFATALLDYRLYKDYFPAWALARWERLSRKN